MPLHRPGPGLGRALHDRQCLFTDRDQSLARVALAGLGHRPAFSFHAPQASRRPGAQSVPCHLSAGRRHWPAADPPLQSPTRCRFPPQFFKVGPPRDVHCPHPLASRPADVRQRRGRLQLEWLPSPSHVGHGLSAAASVGLRLGPHSGSIRTGLQQHSIRLAGPGPAGASRLVSRAAVRVLAHGP